MTWRLEWEERPDPMNKYRKLHWSARAEYDKYWRGIFAVLARKVKVPRLPAARITAGQSCKGRIIKPDPGANYPTAKAAIDGLVDARVLPDDTGEYVKAIVLLPPEEGDRDVFWLEIEEVPDDAPRA